MQIRNMRVNHLKNPMGYEITPLSFSWEIEGLPEKEFSFEKENLQKNRESRLWIKCDQAVIYDSDQEEKFLNSIDTRVELTLLPRTRYQWFLELTYGTEKITGESWFETGKASENWQGKWISPVDKITQELNHGGIILEREFEVTHRGEQYRLYMCGLGVYECYLNGHKAGNEYLAPGYHAYDLHLQAQTYDVSDLLKTGKNKIQIWLGDGWFKGRLGFDGGIEHIYGNRLYGIAELWQGFGAAANLLVATDENWKSVKSPVTFSNIYDGEILDAGKLQEENEINQCQKEAVVIKCPENTGKLGDRYSLPIVKNEEFLVKQWITTPKGETVLDFEQNLTGWIEFQASMPKGSGLRFTAGEILQQGCFYHENLRMAKTEFVYLSDGKTRQVRPHFTFYGFRYVKAEVLQDDGSSRPLTPEDPVTGILAVHLRSQIHQTGRIHTGNTMINQLFSNALWSQKDNFLDIPTDCPQRDERLGWTGDAQIFSQTAAANMYVPAFFRKYLWDMRAEQSLINGAVPNIVPRIKEGMISEYASCPWADAGVVIPWNIYLAYGSKTLLEETYPGMKAWIDYQWQQDKNQGDTGLIQSGFHFADWLALDNKEPGPFGATDPLYIASAYYYYGVKTVAEAAEILGYPEAETYKAQAEKIKTAVAATYFDKEGLCKCRTQTGAALAIMFELTPCKEKQGRELSELVEENQNHLNTGFVGTPILCKALSSTGYHKQAVSLLLNEDYPSWLYSVKMGATTIWERWNSLLEDGSMNPEGMNSLNHYSYGSIVSWMYEYLCGIQLDTNHKPEQRAGYKRVRICPLPDPRLKYAEAQMDTAMGTFKSSWKYKEDGNICYEIEIPAGASSVIALPLEKEFAKEAGTYTFIRKI